ncbi:hypothetical protein PHYBOEH_010702 [Phytophthora boehmeriae]|uniref:Uncharacterized protein n=1 Tax=Phytophthora boehmeriae TaxID=109152 RepID=A0A8T1X3N3_9STRA|nr:hypothetical protein PHYBOEH_010702 [Phytophthora boehmeriae]
MHFNKAAFGALLMICFGTLYTIVSFILPMWTVNKTVNAALTSEVSSTNFKAGIMGFCVDSELTNGTKLDHCFYYKFGSAYDGLSVLNDQIWSTYGGSGICSAYGDAGDVSDATQLEYATVLATAAGMNADQFNKFLDKSCGLLGTATMTFSGMSFSNGFMAIVTFIATMTCRKGNKRWIGASYFFPCVSALTAALTFVLWTRQAKPLGEDDDTSLKASFFLMIVAMLHYPAAVFMYWKYQKLQPEEKLDEESVATAYAGVETPQGPAANSAMNLV